VNSRELLPYLMSLLDCFAEFTILVVLLRPLTANLQLRAQKVLLVLLVYETELLRVVRSQHARPTTPQRLWGPQVLLALPQLDFRSQLSLLAVGDHF